MKTFFICTTNITRGAEIVLKDYLSNNTHTKNISIITNNKHEVKFFFSDICVQHVYANCFFSATGGSKTIMGFLKKIYFVVRGSIYLRKLILLEKPSHLVGNNTGDILFFWIKKTLSRKNKPRTIQLIHDMINTGYYKLILKIGNPFVDHFVAVSEAVKASLVKNGIDEKRITVIYNGIKKSEMLKKDYDNNKINIGFVGAIEHRKSPLSTILLIDLLAEKLRTFYFAYSEVKQTILKKLITGKQKEKILFFQKLDRDALYKNIYDNIYFLFIPSFSEPFPTVMLEALSLGIPVIARAEGGIVECVVDKFNGFLFKNDCELILIANKIGVLNNREYQKMCHNAYCTAQNFTLEMKRKKLNAIIFEDQQAHE